MAAQTMEYSNDRNIDWCLSWLNDQLRLTPEEEAKMYYTEVVQFGKPVKKKIIAPKRAKRLTDDEKKYILENYKTRTLTQLGVDLNRTNRAIDNFLIKNGLQALRHQGRHSKITFTDREYIRENYKTMTCQEISDVLNVSSITIYRAIKKMGLIIPPEITARRGKEAFFTEEKIKELREIAKKMTVKELALHYGCDKKTVRNALKKYNINERLTDTEIKILREMANGFTDSEIGQIISRRLGYVQNVINNIYRKLDLLDFTYPVRRVKAVLVYFNDYQ